MLRITQRGLEMRSNKGVSKKKGCEKSLANYAQIRYDFRWPKKGTFIEQNISNKKRTFF